MSQNLTPEALQAFLAIPAVSNASYDSDITAAMAADTARDILNDGKDRDMHRIVTVLARFPVRDSKTADILRAIKAFA